MVSLFKHKWMNEEIVVVPYSEYERTLEGKISILFFL